MRTRPAIARRPARGLVALLPLAACLLGGCAAIGPIGAAPSWPPLHLGAYAGYAEHVPAAAPVTSIGAVITVPRVLARSRSGLAATWIGASAPGATARTPFIQVGVEEARHRVRGRRRDSYFTVWSDTAERFRLIPLFPVRPGDRLAAGLWLAGGAWTVSITDETRGRSARFATPAEAGATFEEAEMFQEDPASGANGRRLTYPLTGPVRFRAVRVDGTPVAAGRLTSAWMSAAGRTVAPDALARGGFTLRAVRLGTTGERYLHLTHGLYRAIGRPNRKRVLVRALRAGLARLDRKGWPARARPALRTLAGCVRALLGDERSPARANWARDRARLDRAEARAAARLALPTLPPED